MKRTAERPPSPGKRQVSRFGEPGHRRPERLTENLSPTGCQAPDTAAEVYLASNIAIRVDTDAERAYMDYLASRLRLTPAARQELDRLL